MSTVASGCLAVAAAVIAWPVSGGRARRRRRRLLDQQNGGGWAALRERGLVWLRDARGAVPAIGLLAGVAGAAFGGPVAGLVAGVYGTLGVRAARKRERRRAETQARTRAVDALAGLAADLRAGLPLSVPADVSTVDGLSRRVASAVTLAEDSGAPLADLLERIEVDARAVDRAVAAADAQSAGARVTAWLLAGLPVAGIALGYAIGADPLHVLLRTPIGAACATVALALQVAGLAWASRLARVEVAA